MTRSHHDEFVAVTLRDAFFNDPNQLLTEITALSEQPVIELWNALLAERSARGEATSVATGLNATLVNIGPSLACALITLPLACQGEAMYVALVALGTSFRYLTLTCSTDPDDVAQGVGRLFEWTSLGPAIDPDVSVALSPSEFVSAVRRYVS